MILNASATTAIPINIANTVQEFMLSLLIQTRCVCGCLKGTIPKGNNKLKLAPAGLHAPAT
jgi:hypothetical protein